MSKAFIEELDLHTSMNKEVRIMENDLNKIKELMQNHKEEELIRHSNLVETLCMHLHDERRPLTIFLIDGFLDRLEEKENLTVRDIQTVRLLHSQILDQLQEIQEKGLRQYLEKVLERLEEYLNNFYNKYGYLPPYAYYEEDYRGRRKRYEYTYPIDVYYKRAYPPKEHKRTIETLHGIQLTEETKDDIKTFLNMEYKPKVNQDEEIQKVLEYTAYRLQKDLEELRKKRLERESRLSKDEEKEKREKLIDLILEGLKSYKIS